MNNEDDLFADAARALLQDQCTPQRVRAIENGESPKALWSLLEEAGFADALVPEAQGGAGLPLAQVFGVWTLCGSHAVPVPLAETMMARGLLALAGVQGLAGSITLAEGRIEADGSLRCAGVRLGRVADAVLVQHSDSTGKTAWRLLAVAQAASEPAAFRLDADVRWTASQVAAAPLLSITVPQGLDVRSLHACLVAAQMSGVLMDVFQRTLQYANERNQFGRPIGKFQAIQHQLAVMSEHVFAARMAAQLGCASDGMFPDCLRVAVAKARCSEAAWAVAEAGHAIHGAIGFTEEYDLQLYTRRLHNWRQTAGSESYWHAVAGRVLVNEHQGLTLDLLRSVTDVTA
jgi:acyl-CoA dehydrogenase